MRYSMIMFIILIYSCQTQTKYPEGGFDYPINLSNNDTNFYFYPLKDIESKKNAFHDTYVYLFYQPFNEPNLSIKPLDKETFRLTYVSTSMGNIIVTFNADSLTIKKGNPTTLYIQDTSKLSEIENFHFKILKGKFPIDPVKDVSFAKHNMDSLLKLYPQLLDASYYHKLYTKTIASSKKVFTPDIKKMSITNRQYLSIIQQLNSSGFWSMPYQVNCKYAPRHADSFILEANTKKKYKIVSSVSCPDDSTRFTKACQKIVDLARQNKEIRLIWNGRIDTVKTN